MKVLTKRLIGSVVAVGVLSSIAVACTAGMADAATPVKTVPVYSWTGNSTTFKAPTTIASINPYTITSSSVTVVKNGVVVAKDVKSYKATPGTYEVTTTIKYTSHWDFVLNKWETVPGGMATNCRVVEVNMARASSEVSYAQYYVKCTRTGTATNGQIITATPTFLHGSDVLANDQTPSKKIGDSVPDFMPAYPHTVSGFVERPQTVYYPEATKTTTQTVVVKAIKNAPTMSAVERATLKDGDSLSRVRAIVGSKGTQIVRWKNQPGLTEYIWKHEDGKKRIVSFYNGKLGHISFYNR